MVKKQDPKLEVTLKREKPIKIEDTKPSEPKLEMEIWKQYAPLVFGIQSEIFAGAFYGKSGLFSKSECFEIIKSFMNKVIKE